MNGSLQSILRSTPSIFSATACPHHLPIYIFMFSDLYVVSFYLVGYVLLLYFITIFFIGNPILIIYDGCVVFIRYCKQKVK
ncbi:hypothetical protein BCR42DRAFT_423829 [Absidia repens]|uniref:Uncharacterized protein n=1 Tax=Absidia repens TaxID=90262 RepID=A0A1X2I4L6_9FUNG|nr:hypothetical protein BCR42DRAFT_423829 [Absidia repens]